MGLERQRPHCQQAINCPLQAVRTCYNIFLLSKFEVNQNTAKASLTQVRLLSAWLHAQAFCRCCHI